LDAVQGLDLEVGQGEAVALVGESGCGKSTAALALLGLLPDSAKITGSIRFEGNELTGLAAPQLRRLRGRALSMIFQEPMSSLNPVQRVGDQIAESLVHHLGMTARAARSRAIELLELVQITDPSRRVDDYPHQLSGGQRQRVMIAIAVACGPRLLVADEPTTALDVTVQAQILSLLDNLRRQHNMGLLFITHDLGIVSQWADRVVVMHGGRDLESGPAIRIFTSPQHPYTQGLMKASLHCTGPVHYSERALVEIESGSVDVSGKREFRIVRGETRALTAGQHSGATRIEAHLPLPDAPPLIEAIDLAVSYAAGRLRRSNAVDGVSLKICAGRTIGLVGESGCGKSTLARALMRLVPLRSGTLRFAGQDISRSGERALKPFRRRIQMVFQDPFGSLNPRHSVGFILESALTAHGEGDRASRQRRAAELLERVGLDASAAQRYPNEFSGGQRQRIGIARALMAQPDLLILDEPVSALDVSVQAQILNLLVELKSELGLAYLFISHDLTVVRYMADEVIVMREGRFLENAPQREFWASPKSAYARELLAVAPRNVYSDAVIPPST
jgi:peptide/nickel transport system ATP-binding protein